jgi:hypothetical protein
MVRLFFYSMLSEDFSQSWFNREHIVARRKLKPFNLWHYTYLNFVDSPFVVAQKEPVPPTWADIELATRICQLEYEKQLPAKDSLLSKLSLQLHLFITMARSTEERERAAFFAYMVDYFAPPKFNEWKSNKSLMPRGGPPDPLSVASACIMLFGGGPVVEKWVWEMPIGRAYWYASTLHYNRGAPLDYMTARDEAWRRYLRELRERGEI